MPSLFQSFYYVKATALIDAPPKTKKAVGFGMPTAYYERYSQSTHGQTSPEKEKAKKLPGLIVCYAHRSQTCFHWLSTSFLKNPPPLSRKKCPELNFSLDFIGVLFEYRSMDCSKEIIFINDRDYWWWLSSDKGVSSPLF